MSDVQWEILRTEAEAVMADLRRATGRPMVHDLRAMCDAVGYVVRNGTEWRALPVDFPPWGSVYAFFERWTARGLPQDLADRLRPGCGSIWVVIRSRVRPLWIPSR